jgi:anti-anti-sigma factor
MDLRLERAGPAVVFHVEKGSLVIDEDTGELQDLVRAVATFDLGCGVVLDLEKVLQLDCCGIGQLVQLRGEVCDSGGVFSLVNVAPRHKRLFDLLGLLRVLSVFASQGEAITACWSARARGCVPPPVRPEWLREALRPATGGRLQPGPAV